MPKKRTKKIKVGVVGAARGKAFGVAAGAKLEMELVALCDTWQRRQNIIDKQRRERVASDIVCPADAGMCAIQWVDDDENNSENAKT